MEYIFLYIHYFLTISDGRKWYTHTCKHEYVYTHVAHITSVETLYI